MPIAPPVSQTGPSTSVIIHPESPAYPKAPGENEWRDEDNTREDEENYSLLVARTSNDLFQDVCFPRGQRISLNKPGEF